MALTRLVTRTIIINEISSPSGYYVVITTCGIYGDLSDTGVGHLKWHKSLGVALYYHLPAALGELLEPRFVCRSRRRRRHIMFTT